MTRVSANIKQSKSVPWKHIWNDKRICLKLIVYTLSLKDNPSPELPRTVPAQQPPYKQPSAGIVLCKQDFIFMECKKHDWQYDT